jgi:hypothetical protein
VVLLAIAGGAAFLIAGSSTPLPSGTPAGQGFLCHEARANVFVTWSTTSGSVHGSLKVTRSLTEKFTGTLNGDTIDIEQVDGIKVPTGSAMTVNGDSLTIIKASGKTTATCTLESKSAAQGQLFKSPLTIGGRSAESKTDGTSTDRSSTSGAIAAESNLTNALIIAKTIYAKTGAYPATTAALVTALQNADPALGFTAGPAIKGRSSVSAVGVSPDVIIMSALDKVTGCYIISDNEATTTFTVAPGDAVAPGEHYGWVHTSACTASTAAKIPRTPVTGEPGAATWQPNFRTLGETGSGSTGSNLKLIH